MFGEVYGEFLYLLAGSVVANFLLALMLAAICPLEPLKRALR